MGERERERERDTHKRVLWRLREKRHTHMPESYYLYHFFAL